MILLSINNLSKSIGEKLLFKDVSFGLTKGEKVGIIGINGSGKSTLLSLILGKDVPDTGEIIKNRDLKISILNQNPAFLPENTVYEHIYSSNSTFIKVIKSYEKICELYELDPVQHENEYSKIHTEMDRLGAWEYESKIKSILVELGLKNLNLKLSELSGGNLKKIELVRAIIEESDLLVLDEPTNHLDVETVVWLENYLSEIDKSVILITHDRYFLDRIVDMIIELDSSFFRIFKGNYNYYLEKKIEIELNIQKEEDKRRSFLRNELEWLGRQPKARTTKQKARIERAETAIDKGFRKEEAGLELNVLGKRQGKLVMEVVNLTKSYKQRKIINNFTYYFKKNEKIGLVGSNGSGKTTLLNLIYGKIQPDSGYVKPGINTSIGYFEQTYLAMNHNTRVLEYIRKNVAEFINLGDGNKISASQMLERFLFPSRMHSLEINKLSGGEKKRLFLVEILMKNPNFLIFDEPTNDLDIKTLSVLEEFLFEFSGTVIVVSHDRYFMDRVCDSILYFDEDGSISSFVGTYSQYLIKNSKKISNKEIDEKIINKSSESKKEKNSKLSFKEKRELELIEIEIQDLELNKKRNEEIVQKNQSYKDVESSLITLKDIIDKLEQKYKRWEELSLKESS